MNKISVELQKAFAQEVCSILEAQGFIYVVHETTKNNNVPKIAIAEIPDGGTGVAVSLGVEPLMFESAKALGGTVSPSWAAEQVLLYRENVYCPDNKDILSQLEWDNAKDKVVLMLVNSTKNSEYLQTVPNRRYIGDLSIIYKVIFDGYEDGMMTMIINNAHCDNWGVDEETLYKQSLINSPTLLPAKTLGMDEVVKSIYEEQINQIIAEYGLNEETIPYIEDLREQIAMVGEMSEMPGMTPMHILTNDVKCNGCSAMLYPGMIDNLVQMYGDGFYAIPSSIHEWIIIPTGGILQRTEDFLESILHEVNRTALEDTDFLSDMLFCVTEGRLIAVSNGSMNKAA